MNAKRHKSDPANQPVIIDFLTRLRPDSIVEVGIGYGEYGDLIRAAIPQVTLLGIEVFCPYLDQVTPGVYDLIETSDLRHIPDSFWQGCDITIWIDGPEHLAPDESLQQIQRLRSLSRLGLLCACPIVDYPQGAVNGNEYERHLSQWSVAGMKSVGAEVVSANEQTGVFWMPNI